MKVLLVFLIEGKRVENPYETVEAAALQAYDAMCSDGPTGVCVDAIYSEGKRVWKNTGIGSTAGLFKLAYPEGRTKVSKYDTH